MYCNLSSLQYCIVCMIEVGTCKCGEGKITVFAHWHIHRALLVNCQLQYDRECQVGRQKLASQSWPCCPVFTVKHGNIIAYTPLYETSAFRTRMVSLNSTYNRNDPWLISTHPLTALSKRLHRIGLGAVPAVLKWSPLVVGIPQIWSRRFDGWKC